MESKGAMVTVAVIAEIKIAAEEDVVVVVVRH